MNWTWSDAWLLISIDMASDNGGADPEGIIRAGDRINHAIFTSEELKTGLGKLTSAGYIKMEDSKFYTTEKFKEVYEKLGVQPKTPLKVVDEILQLLNSS